MTNTAKTTDIPTIMSFNGGTEARMRYNGDHAQLPTDSQEFYDRVRDLGCTEEVYQLAVEMPESAWPTVASGFTEAMRGKF